MTDLVWVCEVAPMGGGLGRGPSIGDSAEATGVGTRGVL